MFWKLHFTVQSNFKRNIVSYVLTKLQSESLWKLRTAIINRAMMLQLIICYKKELLFCFFFYKTRGNTRQVLEVQIGSYRYDE